MKLKVTIITDNNNYILEAEEGENLLQLLTRHNIEISSPCGGRRSCGKCRVKVLEGNVDITETERELLSTQELAEGYRLACCIELASDLKIEVALEGQIQVLTGGLDHRIDFNPWLRVFEMEELQEENMFLLNSQMKTIRSAWKSKLSCPTDANNSSERKNKSGKASMTTS